MRREPCLPRRRQRCPIPIQGDIYKTSTAEIHQRPQEEGKKKKQKESFFYFFCQQSKVLSISSGREFNMGRSYSSSRVTVKNNHHPPRVYAFSHTPLQSLN